MIRFMLFAAVAAASAQQTPPRDAVGSPPVIGDCRVSGVVVTDDADPHPVRRAIVALASPDSRGRVTVTDDAGRFVFVQVPSGRFTLSASRAGFVTATYGAKRPNGQGSPITLTSGQVINDLRLKMLRGGVISGTVFDQTGAPLQDAYVNVLRSVYSSTGGRTMSPANIGLGEPTDDRGMYRVYGLPPGDYQVVVSNSPGVARAANEIHQLTAAEIQWAMQQLRPAASPTPAAATTTPPPRGPAVTYAPVFHPGTVISADARTITLGAGEERSGVDVAMQLVPTARIDGTIVAPDGNLPANLQVNMLSHDRIEGLPFSGFTSSPQVRNGKFSFSGLLPGRYTITVRVSSAPPPGQRGTPPPPSPPPGGVQSVSALFAIAVVDLNGVDTNVTLTLQSGVTLSGRVLFDDDASSAPADLTRTRLSLGPPPGSKTVTLGVGAATVDATGAFKFIGVTPGLYQVSGSVPGGRTLKSVLVNGQDALDAPFEVGSDNLGEIVVTFTSKSTDLSGRIQDGAGNPGSDFTIVLFPADQSWWKPGSRRVQAKRASSDGHFSFTGLPPGEYLVAAVNDVEPGQWYDSAFLAQLAPQAIKIGLAEGEKKVQDIKIARTPSPLPLSAPRRFF